MRIFELLEKRKKNRRMHKTDEYKFYSKNSHILDRHPEFARFLGVENAFELIRANIIIRGLLNKQKIEEILDNVTDDLLKKGKKATDAMYTKAIKNALLEMPHIEDREQVIIIPFFSRAMNVIYLNETEKLLTYPYNELKTNYIDSLIDPFETYNYQLFDSFFTRLVPIASGKTCHAFFSIDALSILVINNQGRLDIEIPLFDRYQKNENVSQVLTRAQSAMQYYFNNDKVAFIRELRKQKLISERMYYYMKKINARGK